MQGTGKWYELQDLQVTDILPQMITLSEAYIQVGVGQHSKWNCCRVLLAGPGALSVRRSDYVAPEVNQTFRKEEYRSPSVNKKCVCGFVSLAEICNSSSRKSKVFSDFCAHHECTR